MKLQVRKTCRTKVRHNFSSTTSPNDPEPIKLFNFLPKNVSIPSGVPVTINSKRSQRSERHLRAHMSSSSSMTASSGSMLLLTCLTGTHNTHTTRPVSNRYYYYYVRTSSAWRAGGRGRRPRTSRRRRWTQCQTADQQHGDQTLPDNNESRRQRSRSNSWPWTRLGLALSPETTNTGCVM